jgi:hypothetical protein
MTPSFFFRSGDRRSRRPNRAAPVQCSCAYRPTADLPPALKILTYVILLELDCSELPCRSLPSTTKEAAASGYWARACSYPESLTLAVAGNHIHCELSDVPRTLIYAMHVCVKCRKLRALMCSLPRIYAVKAHKHPAFTGPENEMHTRLLKLVNVAATI